MPYFALIPAAGSGARFAAGGGALPKQYLKLNGRPMLWHAVKALCAPPIETVFVVLSAHDEHFVKEDWSAFGPRLAPLFCGGASRRDSVLNGLLAAMATVEADDWVLVHDAARPCLPAKDLARLIEETSGEAVGAILALPAADTVKRAARDGSGTQRIAATEERSLLWLAQTPQMFRAGVLLQALQRSSAATDEAAAIEALGLQPRLVAGSRENLKVTYPEDLAIAAAILERREARSKQ